MRDETNFVGDEAYEACGRTGFLPTTRLILQIATSVSV